MVRLRVMRGFRDLEAGVHRKPGEVFEVSEPRARIILAAGVAEIVEMVNEAAEPAPIKKRRSKKG